MGKERAIALLGTAKTMESPEDMRSLIAKALLFLRTEPDIVPGLEMAEEMIGEAHARLKANLPDWADHPTERAEKIAICESALLQIKEYAAEGLKARAQGSLDVAEELIKGRLNRSLQDYEDTKITIDTHDGHPVETTMERLEAVADAVAADPRIRALERGE